jgi:hypothetical protein
MTEACAHHAGNGALLAGSHFISILKIVQAYKNDRKARNLMKRLRALVAGRA